MTKNHITNGKNNFHLPCFRAKDHTAEPRLETEISLFSQYSEAVNSGSSHFVCPFPIGTVTGKKLISILLKLQLF